MDPITRQAIAVGGGAAAGDPVYVDEVFSTFLYDGSQPNAQTINNGLDLSGEGGLVWLKRRSSPNTSHFLFDTERGASSTLGPDSAGAAYTSSRLSSFNSNGFSLTNDGYSNGNGHTYASWSFRKAPGFFDVVTYTGNGAAGRTVSHNLGSAPGFIIVKRYSATEDWTCYHRSLGATKYIELNDYANQVDDNRAWNDTEPTSSVFTVGTHDRVNTNGQNYVAYVFAHDDQSFGTDGDESIVKCGSYTGNTANQIIDLGFEPQFVLVKKYTSGQNWFLFDSMRGMSGTTNGSAYLYANATDYEQRHNYMQAVPNGFQLIGSGSGANDSGSYIYIAIRRPHKPPTAGTEVFAPQTTTPDNASWTPGFAPDALVSTRLSGTNKAIGARITGAQSAVYTNSTTSESSGTNYLHWDLHTGTIKQTLFQSSSTGLHYAFKRAPEFFDVVSYTGTGSARTVDHGLGVAPQLMLVKNRDDYYNWRTYDSINGGTKYMFLNSTSGSATSSSEWNNTAPTATQFTVGSSVGTNKSGDKYIAYLFASLAEISKVGSYTGTGYDVNVDCGFSAGARFILIKRTDSSSDWYVWNSARGIVATNDPYVLWNNTAGEVTNTNYIDPLNAGFTVRSTAPAALNASGGTYLFLAIA